MEPSTPPTATAIEVAPARPTDADKAALAHLGASQGKSLPLVTYVVKMRLKVMPPATSQGWALYVNEFRIPKYWEYQGGIFFKIFDPQFFSDHRGQSLRFSQNGVDFIDTGLRLPALQRPPAKAALPDQDKVLAKPRQLRRGVSKRQTKGKAKRKSSGR